MYYGALSYADDVVLLCPSLRGLQSMLHICSKFGEEFHMSFNHSKTVCMYMSKSELKCDFNIQLDGKQISWVKSCKYLGTIITPDLNDTADILCKRGQFISTVNNLLRCFSKVPCNLLNQLFDTYCCSFYGCQTWHLENNNLQKIQTAYNKALRKIWKLPYMSNTKIVLAISSKINFLKLIARRFVSLYMAMLKSTNPCVSFIVNFVQHDKSSQIGSNIDLICNKYNLHDYNDIKQWYINYSKSEDTQENDIMIGHIVRELVLCLENNMELSNFSKNEIQSFIDSITLI